MKTRIILVATLGLLICTTAFAVPISPDNTRPVPVTIPSPDGAGKDLQTILDSIFFTEPPGTVSAINDQQSAGMWTLSAYPYNTSPAVAFEYSALDNFNKVGLWSDPDMDDATDPNRLLVFKGAATPGTTASLTWDLVAGTLTIVGDSSKVNTGVFAGLGGINPFSFGFYLEATRPLVPDSLWYTVDQLNNGGQAHALAYRKPTSDTWAIAFEDLPLGLSDKDYNDLVLKVESIEPVPVPEPATMLLLGSGLIGLAGFARRKLKK